MATADGDSTAAFIRDVLIEFLDIASALGQWEMRYYLTLALIEAEELAKAEAASGRRPPRIV